MPITCCRASRFEGDTTERKTNLEQARAAYQHCIDQGALAPSDATLTVQIVGGVCRPYLQQVAQALEELE